MKNRKNDRSIVFDIIKMKFFPSSSNRFAYSSRNKRINDERIELSRSSHLILPIVENDELLNNVDDDEIGVDQEAVDERSPPLSGFAKTWVEGQLAHIKNLFDHKTAEHKVVKTWDDCWFETKVPVLYDRKPKVEYFLPVRLFVFVPRLMGYTIFCPHCSGSKVESKGWMENPIARRVVDVNDCFFLSARRFKCLETSCLKSFTSTNSEILKKFPETAQQQFPAILTARSGVSIKLIELLRSVQAESVGVDAFRRLLTDNHMRLYD